MQIVRCTIDLFRPIPLRPLSVVNSGPSGRTKNPGGRCRPLRRRQSSSAGRPPSRSAPTEIELPRADAQWVEPAGPEAIDVLRWDGYGDKSISRFHYDAVEIRSVDDSFTANRPGLSWFRMKSPFGGRRGSDPFHPPRHSRRHGQWQFPSARPRAVDVRQSRHHHLQPPPARRGIRRDAFGGNPGTDGHRSHRHLAVRPDRAAGADQPGPVDRAAGQRRRIDERTIVR